MLGVPFQEFNVTVAEGEEKKKVSLFGIVWTVVHGMFQITSYVRHSTSTVCSLAVALFSSAADCTTLTLNFCLVCIKSSRFFNSYKNITEYNQAV